MGRSLRTLTATVGRTIALAPAVYLATISAAAWVGSVWPRSAAPSTPPPSRRFSILIPAHDEERLIASTIDSLTAQDYPPDLFDIHVVADNCTDATAEIANAHGAHVHPRTAPDDPGKGPALEWLMSRLESRDRLADTVVFLDADTTAEPTFLGELDRHMSDDRPAVQVHYAVRDDAASPLVAYRAASFAARNYLRPLGRVTLGGTAGLAGNGMAFTRDTIRGHRWSNHLTEDAELALELLREGITVGFVPTARIEAEMPANLDAARSQHNRWEQGRLDLARRYVPALLRDALRGSPAGRVASIDAALDTLLPPLSVVVSTSAGYGVIAFARTLVRPSTANRRDALLAAAALGCVGLYVISALELAGMPRRTYRALVGAPKLIAWKVAQWGGVLLRPRDDGWIRTARNS